MVDALKPAFTLRRRVAFSETDAAGILHFSNYFRFMEDCEHAFLRSLGLSVHPSDPRAPWFGFPRVDVHARYHAPLRFEDEVDVALHVTHVGARSIRYAFRFLRDGQSVAEGEMAVVCTVRDEEGKMKATPLPAALAAWGRAGI